MKQSFLFLQGPHGPFFHALGRALAGQGHQVTRVAFNGGDLLDWPGRETVLFRKPAEAWPDWLGALVARQEITDLVLYGDCRPLHRAAIELVRPLGIRIHVFEEGYFRPDWITLEPDGVNGHSRLAQAIAAAVTRDAAAAAQADGAAGIVIPESVAVGRTTGAMARLCVRYYLAQAATGWLFRHYRSHRPESPWRELNAWLRRSLTKRRSAEGERRAIEALLTDPRPMFLLPLQLDSDAQIRVHSPFTGMAEVIEHIVASFARHAPATDRLLIKNHPLDAGVIDYRRLVAAAAARHGVPERVAFVEGGHLPTLLRCAKGIVTVNSTAGLQAIHHLRPTKVLGSAVYAVDGLVDPQPLATFWRAPQAPDPLFYRAFRAHVMARCQFNGTFFTPRGRDLLLGAVTQRLAAQPQAIGAAARNLVDVARALAWEQVPAHAA
jgi:capsular polysaccharide export protein